MFSGHDAEEFLNDCLSMWVSLLDNQEKYYEGSKNGSILKNHIWSLKKGLEFLGKLYLLSIDGNLGIIVRQLATYVKHFSCTTYEEENGDLGRIMINLVNIFNITEYGFIFDRKTLRHNYEKIIDLLLENISVVKSPWYNNNNATADAQTVAFEKNVGQLRMALTYCKPLCICLAHSSHKYSRLLDYLISDAAIVIYLLFVDKMDRKTVAHRLNMEMYDLEKIGLDIYRRFLEFRSLDKLMQILATNSASLCEPGKHLYENLRELQTLLANSKSEMLSHSCGISESTKSLCYLALPIVSSIYVKEDMHRKLDRALFSVVYQIKLFKLRNCSQQIKLFDYPKVDGLGFLEFFLGHLKELQGYEKMSVIRREIEALHMDIHCLVSSSKTSEEKLTTGELWTHIVRLAYQAEYVMDLYFVIPDSRCILTLSNIVEEVKQIKEKVFALPHKQLQLEGLVLTTSNTVHGTPLHVNDVLVGFHEEIEDIMENLLTGESDLQVIYVVGMGGAGKTSLAKHLFEKSSVDEHFDTKAWCTISQTYQKKDLLLKIFNQINKSDIKDRDDEQELADELCRSLKRRRYLVIIDDLWDVSLWNYLRLYFPAEKTQSRILITTRTSDVASKANSTIYQLRALTEHESWQLLKKKLPPQESLPEYMEIIAKKVAKSCKGLPLSIVIIGSLLHHAARNEEIWNQIAKDVTSTILSDPRGNCKAILELSYNQLPDNLKSCFLYIGVFPDYYEISVTHLIRLWVAEGLVRGRMASDVCVESVGKRYVDDLMSRSLVIPITEKTEGGVKSIQLHDLLRDFCLQKAKEEHFFSVVDRRGILHSFHCPRRMSINGCMEMHLPSSWNSIRTIISFDYPYENQLIRTYWRRMMLLNVFDVPELGASASILHHYVHLRYLAVWKLNCGYRFFVELSFSKLLNLQVLILHFSKNDVIEVPDFIWDMVKLRHIDIRKRALFPKIDSKKMEDSIVLLENLKSLSKACLAHEDENWLRKLPNLQKLKCILSLSFDDSLQQYRSPELNLCNRLTSLNVKCDRYYSCKLHLPESLRKLSMSRFNLDSDYLSRIGKSLPNLEVLKLNSSIVTWSVNDEDFPKLKVLKIVGWYVDQWDATEDSFPKLEQLSLRGCHKLEKIPLSFGDIPNLGLISVIRCRHSIETSAREIQKIQAEAQNLKLKVYIVP